MTKTTQTNEYCSLSSNGRGLDQERKGEGEGYIPSYALDYAKGNRSFQWGGSAFWFYFSKWFQISLHLQTSCVLRELNQLIALKLLYSINT